jgi:hypothetical protein
MPTNTAVSANPNIWGEVRSAMAKSPLTRGCPGNRCFSDYCHNRGVPSGPAVLAITKKLKISVDPDPSAIEVDNPTGSRWSAFGVRADMFCGGQNNKSQVL